MSKKLTEEQKKQNKEKRVADKMEKKYGEIGRKIDKIVFETLKKYKWVIWTDVVDERGYPLAGKHEVIVRFVPKVLADKEIKRRMEEMKKQTKVDYNKLSNIVDKKSIKK